MNQKESILYHLLELINKYYKTSNYISAYDISRSGWYPRVESLDDYGTATMVTNDEQHKKFTIFHTDSDCKLKRNPNRVITLFIVYENHIAEVGDVYFDTKNIEYCLENYRLFTMPVELHPYKMEIFSGSNGFLYYPKDNIITLRMDLFSLSKLPKSMITDNTRVIIKINPNYMRKLKMNDIDI